tara:strand:+ start:797 stop:1879 length:1083 start_codon:yes stop_codon:yes gene_type:complete
MNSIKKRIAIIGTVGIPAKYGGFETLADYLVQNLSNEYEFSVYCCKNNYKERPSIYNGAKLIYLPINANGKSSVFYDTFSIIHSLFYADTILILGVSAAFTIPFVKFFTKKKIITNIDGLEWKRDKWGRLAKKYLKWQESIAVKNSHNVIVDNKGIENYVTLNYNISSDLIAYGGDHVFYKKLEKETILKYGLPNQYAFKVCRIEPENNIHLILAAFSRNFKYNLVFIGNWNSSQYGQNLKTKYKDFDNILLLDPIYNQNVLNEIRSNCYIYIHGHSAGGTNPSLVEAMCLGLPILAFDVNYNRFTMNNMGYYFSTEENLFGLLKNLKKDEIIILGNHLKKYATSNYTWSAIANQYSRIF